MASSEPAQAARPARFVNADLRVRNCGRHEAFAGGRLRVRRCSAVEVYIRLRRLRASAATTWRSSAGRRASSLACAGLFRRRGLGCRAARGAPGRRRRSVRVTSDRDVAEAQVSKRQEFVIAGYTDRTGSSSQVGSLLLGVHAPNGDLQSVGSVGTGWDAKEAAALKQRLSKIEIGKPPFAAGAAKPGVGRSGPSEPKGGWRRTWSPRYRFRNGRRTARSGTRRMSRCGPTSLRLPSCAKPPSRSTTGPSDGRKVCPPAGSRSATQTA